MRELKLVSSPDTRRLGGEYEISVAPTGLKLVSSPDTRRLGGEYKISFAPTGLDRTSGLNIAFTLATTVSNTNTRVTVKFNNQVI